MSPGFTYYSIYVLCALLSLQVKGFQFGQLNARVRKDFVCQMVLHDQIKLDVADVLNVDSVPPRSPFRQWLQKMTLPARKFVTAAGILSASFVPMRSAHSSNMPSSNSRTMPSQKSTKNSERLPIITGNSFVRDAVRQVGPSVVRIDCEREVSPLMALFNPDFKDGDTMKVSGSGIVVSADGYLLTNSHVVQAAKSITITLSNGRSFKATVVAFDELTDLAVLKANNGYYSLPNAPLGDSNTLQSGDWVIAVGCPVGLDFTVTLGIVSSPKRSAIEVGALNLRGTYIQTDAALNSGNSGGPLVDASGQVVGINTMVRTNTEAIGFAIPINRAKQIYEILKSGNKPSHAYFGVDVMTLTPDFARIHNDDPNAQRLPEVHGALVSRVAPNSPAAASGFRKNDIIVDVNGEKVNNSEDADMRLDKCKPGLISRIRVIRGEPPISIEIQANPMDFCAILEERKMRENLLSGLKPPQQIPQRKMSRKE